MYLRRKSSLYNRLQIFITTESSSIVSCLPDQLNPERLDSISDHHLPAAPQSTQVASAKKKPPLVVYVNLGLSLRIEFYEKIVQDERLCVFEVQFWLCIAFFHSPFHITLLLLLIGHDPLSDFFSSFHFVHLHSCEQLGANHNLSCHYIFMGRGLTIFSHFIVTKMAIFLTVDSNEASMCWNCEEMCGKWKFSSHFSSQMWGFFPVSMWGIHVLK